MILASEFGCRVSFRYTRCRPTHQIPVQCWASVTAHCWFNADKLSTRLARHYSNTGSYVYLAAALPSKHCLSPNTVSILAQCLRGWPDIETALRDCPVFADCRITMRVRLSCSRRHKSHYPDNTIHWPNADVMQGHQLRCWANISPNLSL